LEESGDHRRGDHSTHWRPAALSSVLSHSTPLPLHSHIRHEDMISEALWRSSTE
jgi:hypothetical protein